MIINSETNLITSELTVEASPVPMCQPLKVSENPIAIESVIWTIDRAIASADWWMAAMLSHNPEWERDLVGVGAFVEGMYARCYWYNDTYNAVSNFDVLTRQIYLHNYVVPGRIRFLLLTNQPSVTLGMELYYHEVKMGRAEMDSLNVKYGKYRR